ncbi:MAG: glutamate-1-semialdehyde 2,1-aminomutase [Proteobacteria bacterium]|nr:glutamate-1-semialdehyde 2,1-aminomutase [Pseudomonadota bacterium]
MNLTRSKQLMGQALGLIPGGVNSPVRAARAVGGDPPFIVRGQGARVTDVDGNTYLDYVASWGPLICGHAHPEVVEAVTRAAADGTSFGAPTEAEVTLAQKIVDRVPGVDLVRLVNSGTEATMSAVRLARGVTGRPKIVKFDGAYHGHADSFLVAAGSGLATLGIPSSPGVPEALTKLSVSLPYNDPDAVGRAVDQFGHQIAAVIVEPVAGNMGVIGPADGFLPGLRRLCDRAGSLLIFDEVITGFRVARGGAQERYGVTPDLTCLGKIIGGGLPVGAYGGRAELMNRLAPVGDVYQAGTLSGNPLAVAAGLAVLEITSRPGFYESLEDVTAGLCRELRRIFEAAGVPATLNRVGSMFTVFFTDTAVIDWRGAAGADAGRYAKYWRAMLGAGVYLAPSAYEAAFVGAAHTPADVEQTLDAARKAVSAL